MRRCVARGNGGWTDPQTFRFKIALNETPFAPVFTCSFHEQGVTFDMQGSIGFGASERKSWKGSNKRRLLVAHCSGFRSASSNLKRASRILSFLKWHRMSIIRGPA